MRKLIKKLVGVGMSVLLVAGITTPALASGYSDTFNLVGNGDGRITIDGNFSEWDSLPSSYEYNWDNSNNCWYWGVWINGVQYKTPINEYSTDVRHKMQMYTDGDNIYLHIVFSRDYSTLANGNDYQFYVDGQMAAVQVVSKSTGVQLSQLAQSSTTGVYPLLVTHRASGLSSTEAERTDGYLYVTPDKINCELEVRIPLATLKQQNPSININNIATVEFFTPNLMYRRLTAVGTSTGPVLLICIVVGIATMGYCMTKRKSDGDLQV